ncbi:MAG: bifunctional oligoribonuclease/PAP phosphatase NrnA [Candidatus Azambacteria bacterium]|nr:bifunctional oligoribonuclease/PAP phosphatase NrnA [Candidatus Azambacteria bacterium]
MKNSSFKEIQKIIAKSKNILVAIHQGPDADAIGSLAALGTYLKKIKKPNYLLSVSGVPESLRFIPGAKLIKSKHPKTPYDLIIGLDYGSEWRLGLDSYLEKYPKIPILIFDHHPVADQGANFGVIDISYSSTSEIIYDYLKIIKFKIDKNIAYALAAGILTDTGFFKYTASPKPLEAMAELMKKFKIKPVEIDNALSGQVKFEALKLSGKILSRAKYKEKENFVYSWFTRRELSRHHLITDDLRGLVERLRNLKNGRFALLLIEERQNRIRGELRSRPDKNYDVAELAKKFGSGGGHKFAAGFRCKGTIDSVLKLVAKYSKK